MQRRSTPPAEKTLSILCPGNKEASNSNGVFDWEAAFGVIPVPAAAQSAPNLLGAAEKSAPSAPSVPIAPKGASQSKKPRMSIQQIQEKYGKRRKTTRVSTPTDFLSGGAEGVMQQKWSLPRGGAAVYLDKNPDWTKA